MPSPIGHALTGIAVGFFAGRQRGWGFPLVCGLAATLPDVDFLLPVVHRGPTHSIAAAVAAFVVTLAVVSLLNKSQLQTSNSKLQRSSTFSIGAVRIAAAMGLAVLSHVLLDWLGQDSSRPRGLMVLWPWSTSYYISDLNLFNAVDRRYWLDGFWRHNAIAVTKEVVILLPIVVLAKMGTATFFRKE